MIYYATVRRKKDIISSLSCADDFASFKGSVRRLQFRISDRSEEVSERRVTKVTKVKVTKLQETLTS